MRTHDGNSANSDLRDTYTRRVAEEKEEEEEEGGGGGGSGGMGHHAAGKNRELSVEYVSGV